MTKFAVLSAVLIIIVSAGVAASRSGIAPQQPQHAATLDAFGVGALGRIEPQSEVLQVNAPSVMEPPVVEQLMVDVGDKVQAGRILAVLDNHRRKLADVGMSEAAVLFAEKSLAQVMAGTRAGDIQAQEALVERTRARLNLAEKQLDRFRTLRQNNALSQDDLEVRASDVDVLHRELEQQQATLVALKEIRSVDVERAEADIAVAKAALLRAEADLEVSLIRSPIDAEILRIHCRPGERIGPDGLLDLGDTRQMDVVAEVHESDILKVKLQQPAKIFLRNLNTTLHGHVIQVGRLIGRKDVLSNDPVDDTDARVVEVRIRLTDAHGQLVSGMSYARVEVTINATSPKLPCPGCTTDSAAAKITGTDESSQGTGDAARSAEASDTSFTAPLSFGLRSGEE